MLVKARKAPVAELDRVLEGELLLAAAPLQAGFKLSLPRLSVKGDLEPEILDVAVGAVMALPERCRRSLHGAAKVDRDRMRILGERNAVLAMPIRGRITVHKMLRRALSRLG